MKNILLVVVLLVLAAGGIWYFNSSKPVTEPVGSAMPVPNTIWVTEMVVSEDTKEVVVEGTEFKFIPATLTLKKGEKVRLVFKNIGKMTHDWVVDELGVRTKVISGGDEDVVEFTPEQTGTFEYYCSVGKHREMGMKGALTVE